MLQEHLPISTSDPPRPPTRTVQRLGAAGAGWTAALAVGAWAACAPGTARPPFRPLPQAVIDTLSAPPEVVIREVQARIADEGVRVRTFEVVDGFLETDWVTIVPEENGGADLKPHERVVRFRFWADPVVGQRAKLTSEVVHRRTLDPSLPERLVEIMVPSDHDARKILERVLGAVRQQFGLAGEGVS